MRNSFASAKHWLSSTAIRLFSSSTDGVDSENSNEKEELPSNTVRGRGRPRKNPNAPKKPQLIIEQREIGKRRSSGLRSQEIEETGPNDGQVRFLLTFKALPTNLQIIAKTLYPRAKNKYEEHRIVCKILNEESYQKTKEIFIPTFRKLSRARSIKEVEKNIKEPESITDEDCLQRHRPLELAERRERRREDELLRYELYIRKLSKEYPELLNRKYSLTSEESLSSLDR